MLKIWNGHRGIQEREGRTVRNVLQNSKMGVGWPCLKSLHNYESWLQKSHSLPFNYKKSFFEHQRNPEKRILKRDLYTNTIHNLDSKSGDSKYARAGSSYIQQEAFWGDLFLSFYLGRQYLCSFWFDREFVQCYLPT